jgi:hypothetical protein
VCDAISFLVKTGQHKVSFLLSSDDCLEICDSTIKYARFQVSKKKSSKKRADHFFCESCNKKSKAETERKSSKDKSAVLENKAMRQDGESIVSKARHLVNKESLGKDGNASAHIAHEEIMKDEALMGEFLACVVNSGLAKEMRVAIFQKIIWKVLHAVTGHGYREYWSKHTGRLEKTSRCCTVGDVEAEEGFSSDTTFCDPPPTPPCLLGFNRHFARPKPR